MKTFLCIRTSYRHDRNGNPIKKLDIYRRINNKPKLIVGGHKFDYADTIQETVNYLASTKHIPQKLKNSYWKELEKSGIHIVEIFV